jgi:lysophospholipase L1-like esterase
MKKIFFLLLLSTRLFATTYPGTVNGTLGYASGKFGTALNCTHLGWVSFSTAPPAFQVSTGYTMSLWFNTTYNGLAGLAGGTGTWSLQEVTGGYIQIAAMGNGAIRQTSKPYNDGVWHYCAVVLDTFNDFQLYIDGIYQCQVANNGTSMVITWLATTGASTTFAWSGLIDDLAIYNYDIYTSNHTAPLAQTGASTAGLVALYRFENDLTDSNTGYINVTPGTPYRTFVSNTANTITSVTPTLGTSPYTYQWQSAPDVSGLPGTFTNISGATSIILTQTGLTTNTVYWYQLVVTDAGSVSINGPPIRAVTKSSSIIVIGAIGDSITEGYNLSSNQDAVTMLCNQFGNYNGSRVVQQINKSIIGKATSDFLIANNNYKWALAAFKAYGVDIVTVMLGTNDSNSTDNISASSYNTNLSQFVNDLVSNGFKVVVNFPPCPNDGRSGTQITLLQSYLPYIQTLCASNPSNIIQGDINAFGIFQTNAGLYTNGSAASFYQADGLHPNVQGAALLGQCLWFYPIGVVPGIVKIAQAGSLNY